MKHEVGASGGQRASERKLTRWKLESPGRFVSGIMEIMAKWISAKRDFFFIFISISVLGVLIVQKLAPGTREIMREKSSDEVMSKHGNR